MTEAYTMEDFVETVLKEFPELREDFEEDENLPHLQMSRFAYLTQRAKGRGDWETYRRCIEIIDQLYRRPDDELWNVLHVSYLEHLDFEGPRGNRAWELLTPALQEGWRTTQEYLDRVLNAHRQRGDGSN